MTWQYWTKHRRAFFVCFDINDVFWQVRTNAKYGSDLPKSKVKSKHSGDLNIAISLQQKLTVFLRSVLCIILYRMKVRLAEMSVWLFVHFLRLRDIFLSIALRGHRLSYFKSVEPISRRYLWNLTSVFYFRKSPRNFCQFKRRSFDIFSASRCSLTSFLILA